MSIWDGPQAAPQSPPAAPTAAQAAPAATRATKKKKKKAPTATKAQKAIQSLERRVEELERGLAAVRAGTGVREGRTVDEEVARARAIAFLEKLKGYKMFASASAQDDFENALQYVGGH